MQDLKRLGLWDAVMLADLKYFDGDLAPIERIPQDIKTLYATAFDVEPGWLVEAASRRQKWIDQAQSLNLYMAGASGKKLDTLYKLAWVRGLKPPPPAHAGCHQCRKIHRSRRGAECRASRRRHGCRAEILLDRQSGLRSLPVVQKN